MKLESFVAGSVTLIAVRGRGAVTSRARRSAIGAARHPVARCGESPPAITTY